VLHVIVQLPPEQAAMPLVLLQVLPQAPQFATVVFRLTSQPFAAMVSQLPQPDAQAVIAQVPVEHEVVALVYAHPLPHAPQSHSVLRLASQPFTGLPSQSP
jgi:hypothetical protein